ncbi:hypothetical protein FBDF15_14320 [Faecalibacterium duncaniae]
MMRGIDGYSFGADIDSGLALSVTAYAVPPPPKWEALAKPQSLFFARGSPFGGAAERSEAERASPFAF